MTRIFEDEEERKRQQLVAMEINGYEVCENCGTLFLPSESDPEQIVCDACQDYAMGKD
ncbi:hypothetical protein GCM10025886_20360 [Tetragenococcus halophilus subsp. flandriensis]|uniref:hypothetical protein n=1 Tax=Tetragenococcus halophilus TaxID=51669 RepID=UPI000CBE82DF|nr:hypothetical protein [Tetragenococcus halophilus]GBD64861.1 hypothetical protein TEHD23766T_2288 [Tetragenococcus halophilus subsp. flandriensis]GMA08885.1 hypothetical protein GCM10025886_20360 [Tetragenococcus halophilus subsp. flandriensis]